jgi:hypothetical protein
MLFILRIADYSGIYPVNMTAFLPVCRQKAVRNYLKTGAGNNQNK